MQMTPSTKSELSLDNEARLRLAVAVHTLIPLAGWEPMVEVIGGIEDCFSSGAGLTKKEYRKALKWTERINGLDNRLVKFYSEHAPSDKTASTALWRILEGGSALEGWQYRKLRQLWEDQFGLPPAIELCPKD